MATIKLSRAEELARQSDRETQIFLNDKLEAENNRATQIADLKALRLEKEAKEKRAVAKLAKAARKK